MTRKTIAAGTVVLLAMHLMAHAGPVGDPAAFSAQFAETLRREAGAMPVTVKAPLVITLDDMEISLARLYGYCQAQPAGCKGATAEYASGVAGVARDRHTPIDRRNVRLVLRPDAWLVRGRIALGVHGATLAARPLIAGWVVVAVLDTPSSTRPLDGRDLAALGLDEDALFALGAANLGAALAPLDSVARPVTAGQIGTFGGNIYDVSRVALHAQWAALAAAQGGVLVVAMPTSDRVLYVSEDKPGALAALRTLSVDTAARNVNVFAPSLLLRWTNASWVPVQ